MRKKSIGILKPLTGTLLMLFMICGSLFSQSEPHIHGAILDEKGKGMKDVIIIVTDSLNNRILSTLSGLNGQFDISHVKADNSYNLIFSTEGYRRDTVKNFRPRENDRNSLLVRMEVFTSALGEIVVVGYGTQSKQNVTGAISQLKSDDLNQYGGGSSFGQQMAGKVSGVMINESNALPGSDPQIIIRGVSTLTAGMNPLIVVDGFPLSEGSSLNSINPQSIATVDILKDPSSSAIYGARAANGVILITTKNAQSSAANISISAYTGKQSMSSGVKLIDGYQYALYSTEARNWGYMSKDPLHRTLNDDVATRTANKASARDFHLGYIQPWLDKTPGLMNTNWMDAISQKGALSNIDIAIAGNSGTKSNYYLSLDYLNQQGVVINTGLKRYSAELKLNNHPFNWLNIGLNMTPSYNEQKYFDNSGDRNADPISMAFAMYPFFSPYNPDGSLAISQQIKANTPQDGALVENPVAIMKMTTYDRNFFTDFGNAFMELKIADGLKFKTMLGAEYSSLYYNYYSPSNVGGYRTAAPKPAVSRQTNGYRWNYISENTLTYNRHIGSHDISILSGYTFQKEHGDTTVITGSSIPDDNLTNISGATAYAATTSKYTWSLVSYFARIQYSFMNRYLLSMAIRRDGSSRFGANTKYGNFPSLSAGWIISNENFLKSVNWLNLLKLKASWGMAGNNQIGSYGSYALVNPDNYVYGNALAPGFAASTAPNLNLSWETKRSFNLGVDVSVLNHYNLSVNYYNTVTSNLLLAVPVPEQSGYVNSLQNIGKVKNSGLEIEFSADNINLGPIKWSYAANISTNKNTVLALGKGQTQILTGANSAFITKVGGPVAELHGYDVIGIYKTQAAIDNSPHTAGTVIGDYIMKDLDGDGKITTADQKGFGTYQPKLTFGFQTSFAYDRFSLNISLYGLTGRKIYDNALWQMESGESFAMGDQYYYKNRWDPTDNPNGFLGRPTTNLSANRLNARASNQFFYKADYLRVRNIQLDYNVSGDLLRRLKIYSLRLYVSCNNPFTFTGYRGFNPDATTTSNILTSGFAFSNFPIAKSILVGFNLSF